MKVETLTLIVLAFTLLAILWQARANHITALAAQRSADTAYYTLLFQRPFVDITNLRVKEGAGGDGMPSLQLRWKVLNASLTFATLIRIDHVSRLPEGQDVHITGTIKNATIGPDKGFDLPMTLKLTQEQFATYLMDGLPVEIQIRVLVKDAIGQRWNVFTRRVVVKPSGTQSIPLDASTHDWDREYRNPEER